MVFSNSQRVILSLAPPADSNRYYVGIEDVEAAGNTALYPAYPNPAIYQVTIPYRLPAGMSSSLQIFDVAGRQVDEIRLVADQQSVKVNVAGYNKGIYLYRVKGGSEMHKFIVQ